jgi:predicted amidophosphoribosyltransferase
MHVFEQLISAIAPHRCLSCGEEGAPLCLPCCSDLPPAPKCCYKCGKTARRGLCRSCKSQSALETITARTVHKDLAARAVHSLKFERNRSMAEALALCMAGSRPIGIVTYIPTANRRVRQRGYDQARLIAGALARVWNLPSAALLRRVGSQRQLGQSRSIRQQQLQGAFYPASGLRRVPVRTPIILVDDVLTTASTFEAAARTLQHAGYCTVHAHAFAWRSADLPSSDH